LICEGHIDEEFIREHTSGFDEFRRHVDAYALDRVANETGLGEESILRAARTIGQGKRVSFWWTMGVNQSYQGVRTAQSLINLALMTGNIGRPGTGANSITGQCNAMGSRLFSNTTNLLGGHEFTNPEHRKKIARLLDIPQERIPDRNSWAYPQIMEGILDGKIKGLWVIATNPAHSWINQHAARDILSRLDFLVVQDMYHTTHTAQAAHLVLPAAGWGEKEGTFINSERRIGLLKKVAKAPGQALSDFSIFRLVAHYWGCGEMFSRWTDPEAVFHLLKKCSRGQPCDITGIRDYRLLEERRGIQWPYSEGTSDEAPSPWLATSGWLAAEPQRRPSDIEPNAGASQAPPPATLAEPTARAIAQSERRLFEDGVFYHPDARAKFLFDDPQEMPEKPNAKYPLLLLTGRGSASQWHTQTRTGKSEVLQSMHPRSIYVELNPQDARRAGIKPNQPVVVESQRGKIKATAFVTPAIAPGQAFLPMHYEETNRLTHGHFDPHSKQPSYKDCAVNVRPLTDYDDL
jgi:assimilatory nitrate reductase catalytic subunit